MAMRTLVLVLLVVFLTVVFTGVFTGVASAQTAGSLAIYSDLAFTDCSYVDDTPGALFRFYVVHINSPVTVEASIFRVDIGTLVGTYAGMNQHGNWVIGDPFTGVDVVYRSLPDCRETPYIVLSLTYVMAGLSPACTRITLTPHGITGRLLVSDCTLTDHPLTVSSLIVNPDASCQSAANCGPIPVAETSWGAIKALYQ